MFQLGSSQKARGSQELKLPCVCVPGSIGCFVSSVQFSFSFLCLLLAYKILFFMPTDKPPVFGACKRLDIELEMVRWVFSPAILIDKH